MNTHINASIPPELFDWEAFEKNESKVIDSSAYITDKWEAAYNGAGKDLFDGQIVELTGFSGVFNDILMFSTNAIDVPVDLTKESRFLSIHSTTAKDFAKWLQHDNGKEFLKEKQFCTIENAKSLRTSLLGGFGFKLRDEFTQELKTPTKAYECKVISKNGGGFIIDILGVKGFLPGSLAATNIVKDFDSFVGKTVKVMVEDYLPHIDTFVFSNKKYVKHILPHMVDELEINKEYTGHITGVAKFGIFVEIDEIFNGLLHVTKMNKTTFDNFKANKYKKGEEITALLKEISDNHRLVLTTYTVEEQKEFDAKMKKQRADKFLSGLSFNKEEDYSATVLSVKSFGSFVSVINGKRKINGMVVNGTQHEEGAKVKVKFISQDKNKFFFKFA